MNRRLYFLIPDRQHALAVVDELAGLGIDHRHMHAVGDKRTRLDGLPTTSRRQENDDTGKIEHLLWNSNLASFGIALVALIVAPILHGLTWWLLLPAAIMAANLLIGLRFSSQPDTHLGEFRDALAHGEILLMVDVPESRVATVESNVHQHHPEAVAGGVCWGTQAFSL